MSENSRPDLWPKPKLTPAQWDEIVRRYREGETSTDLAREFGIASGAIRNRVTHA